MMLAGTRSAGVCLRGAITTAVLVSVLAIAATASAMSVVGAGPSVDPGDGQTRGKWAITFSPDNDRANDVTWVRVRARAGSRVQLVVTVSGLSGNSKVLDRGATVVVPKSGVARVTWTGMAGRHAYSDGSYRLKVCDVGGECSATSVVAHLRIVSAWIRSTGSFAPGQNVPLKIVTDAKTVTVGLAPDNAVSPREARGVVRLTPGSRDYTLPSTLTPGLYRLIVSTGRAGGWRALPLLVHEGSLAKPAARTTLVVMPYLTWRVYNQLDADRDGQSDSHYQTPTSKLTTLVGPYEVPGLIAPGTAGREQDYAHTKSFMTAYAKYGGQRSFPIDVITDVEFGRLPQSTIGRYAAVMFPGHTEYYTTAIFQRARHYELHGGNFIYGSANGFYALTRIEGKHVRLIARPHDTPKQNASLITGVQYTGCCWVGGGPGPLIATASAFKRAPWVFEGTALKPGSPITWTGGEIDGLVGSVPANLTVIGTIKWTNKVDPPQPAQMVLFTNRGGGQVFAPGTMGFVGSLTRNFSVRQIFRNVWQHFVDAPTRTSRAAPRRGVRD